MLYDIDFKRFLPTREYNVMTHLYRPALQNTNLYVRGVGYFRSSVYRLMTEDLLKFCENGGKVILLTSTEWGRKDYDSLMKSFDESETFGKEYYENEISSLLEDSDHKISDPTRMLVALVHLGYLEIKVAIPRPNEGIYHQKVGYFTDNEYTVAFDGSANETLKALHPHSNVESINVSCSWDDAWKHYGFEWKRYLDRTLKNETDIKVCSITEVPSEFIGKYDIDIDINKYRDAAAERQKNLTEIWDKQFGNKSQPVIAGRDTEKMPLEMIKDRPHQIRALEKWTKNGNRGILKHATGSGKTITALAAIQEHTSLGFSTIIIVPSIPLLDQWIIELNKFSCFDHVNKYYLGGRYRFNRIKSHLQAISKSKLSHPSITIILKHQLRDIAVLRPLMRSQKNGLLNDILLVFDECHRAGEKGLREFCELEFNMTLGLSATPERESGFSTSENDDDSTDFTNSVGDNEAIENLLGKVIDEFSLEDAMEVGSILTPFNYHLDVVSLTAQEQNDYSEYRRQYARSRNKEGGVTPAGEAAIHNARRIVRSASEKIPMAVKIIGEKFEIGQFWLIYCDNSVMLNEIRTKIASEYPGLSHTILEYSSKNLASRDMNLKKFQSEGGILLAMKCLDEGVSIEQISHGLVLSSSTVKREFIQRRGRMLRRAKNKTRAEIYDIVTLPHSSADLFEKESILKHELKRIDSFSNMADNSYDVDIFKLEHFDSTI